MIEHLKNIDLNTWGVIGMLTFLVIFIILVIWAVSRKRSDVDRWASLPIETDSTPISGKPS